MADDVAELDGTEADALGRIEAALDRIAQRTHAPSAPIAPVDRDMVAARLDRLIAQLRDALADASASDQAGA